MAHGGNRGGGGGRGEEKFMQIRLTFHNFVLCRSICNELNSSKYSMDHQIWAA